MICDTGQFWELSHNTYVNMKTQAYLSKEPAAALPSPGHTPETQAVLSPSIAIPENEQCLSNLHSSLFC